MRPPLMMAAILLAGACQMAAEIPAAPPDPPENACGASALQGWIGGPLPQNLPSDRPVRIIGDGDAVTMDFNPERLNILLDGATRSRILAITCG